ncbi:Sec7-domain-containing protein [Polyporus arcularius HHB13444]|uniref:Sec7-domain-containing protein n=1 Tax=Polyporus arcularius HHB13444 TaxID=1314778 RepID=A0A5C3Q588_9APHY|nr:Sec7-domain-containing protein [Polyporus arcularius HHB13444]
MDASDLAQAATVPLPPSPPPHDEPMPGIMAQFSLRDPVNENRARSADGERPLSPPPQDEQHAPESPSHADADHTSIAQPRPFVPNGTAAPPPILEEQVLEVPPKPSLDRAQDTNDSAPPPTPPAKPVPSNPASPAVRRPSALPSIPTSPLSPRVTNGQLRQSIDSRPSTPGGRGPSRPSVDAHKRSLTLSKGHTVSVVLISSALETIAASKEAKRSAPLRESVQRALEMVKLGQGGDRPREIFEPLRLACETRNEKLMIASLDCISKLISYSFFAETSSSPHAPTSPPPSPGPNSRNSMSGSHSSLPTPSLVDLVVHTITSCHTESTPETVSLQIVKALLSLVLSPTVLVHQSSLLKAVRTVYNVFLLSVDPVNQMVAQGGLTQMVNHVFARCNITSSSVPQSESTASLYGNGDGGKSSARASTVSSPRNSLPLPAGAPSVNGSEETGTTLVEEPSEASSSAASVAPSEASVATETTEATEATEGTSGEHVENGKPDGAPNGSHHAAEPSGSAASDAVPEHDDEDEPANGAPHRQLTTNDLFIKDAFLVFRALCKLTMKPLNSESERDVKSHPMRSKLLSLHLVLMVLNSHMPLFVSPSAIIYSSSTTEATPFVQAANQYLCLCLSRNAVSPVPQVFEISVEIFWRVISGLRTQLKKEIEVLLHEIFIPILEMKTSTLKQKAMIVSMLQRLCQDPQALVEIYLNYDCDSEAVDNIYEHLMNIISRIGTAPVTHAAPKANDPASPALQPQTKHQQGHQVPPSFSTAAMSVPGNVDTSTIGNSEAQLRRQGLECLVAVLKSLVAWGTATPEQPIDPTTRPQAEESRRDTMTPDFSVEKLSPGGADVTRGPTPELADDPTKFESAKQKKTTLLEGIKKFNFKPKRGIQFLIEHGFIASNQPKDIARFLLETDGLNKAAIGEYLGEGDEENIAIMHAFVDLLDLSNMPFVDALRAFLQSFRLPGEAQKIDRFMLKFAERYMSANSNTPFANADTAYVLAFSIILLNTDAHSRQIKNRMTKQGFIANNRGINDGQDLPEELLSSIYDEIVNNEIRMKDEVEAPNVAAPGSQGLAGVLANVGRDLQKEAYVTQSNNMANKTEALFRTLMRSQRRGTASGGHFFSASHFVHVRPMFEVAWIPFLAGLSGPLQDTDDLEIVELCLDGFKAAIHIVCFFDLELERNAFVSTLAKFTFLNNLGEMKTKNMEAIKTLLDVAVTEGNHLKASWREVLTCVSQLEHMQLISSGVEMPDTGRKGRSRKPPTEELANESRSTHITVAADMVFSLSHYLSGTAIVDFVRALCDVSWEEIQSSGLSQHPRLFSLQKLVEISYYNMGRIRLEWSNMWEILGEHFNQVCCHKNPHVGFFALDALRQLAMRFLEKEELPHFKFQKDFLRPFEYTMIHNSNPDIRDMVLQCLQQMIQARVHNLRSGWRTMFAVFSAASKAATERIANSAFEIVTRLNKDHFSSIVRHGSFADLTVCITDFCKVSKYQKISLLAIAMLRDIIPTMLECPECGFKEPNHSSTDDPMIKYWFPVLFGFYDVIMNGEDLEVRRLALDSLFSTLKKYGSTYPVEFWDTVCQELLFPMFAVLKSSQDLSRFSTQEDMSVWLSTTMIQALRNLIDLYTFYFETLERFLDGLLDLLCVCICQENDTLARIGTSCLQQLLESNIKKLSPARWERVATTFVKLFRTTTPHQLFDESLRLEIDGSSADAQDPNDPNEQAMIPAPLSPNSEQPKAGSRISINERRRIFRQIIVKCVLQLLLIETTNDLLRNDEVYNTIPPEHLLRLMGVLDHSYQFARMFNEDKELRTGLWKVGFMKHLPNLLKQESSSASTLVHVLLRMYYDPRAEHQAARPQVADRLMPLGLGVLQDFNKLRLDTQAKNIAAWTPVVAEILQGFVRFDDKAFTRYLPAIYPLATDLLSREMAPEIREGLREYFMRVGYIQGIVEHS